MPEVFIAVRYSFRLIFIVVYTQNSMTTRALQIETELFGVTIRTYEHFWERRIWRVTKNVRQKLSLNGKGSRAANTPSSVPTFPQGSAALYVLHNLPQQPINTRSIISTELEVAAVQVIISGKATTMIFPYVGGNSS